MRSRWRGSMFAWILNTKPLNGCSSAATRRVSAACAAGRGRPLHEAIEHFAHAEIAQRGAEEHRRQPAREVLGVIEFVAGAAHQFDLHLQLVEQVAEQRRRFRAVDALDAHVVRDAVSLPLLIDVNGVGIAGCRRP